MTGGPLSPFTCLGCGKVNDNATNVAAPGREAKVPRPGSISICWYCGDTAVWDNEGLRPLTEDERADINRDPLYVNTHAAVMLRIAIRPKT